MINFGKESKDEQLKPLNRGRTNSEDIKPRQESHSEEHVNNIKRKRTLSEIIFKNGNKSKNSSLLREWKIFPAV